MYYRDQSQKVSIALQGESTSRWSFSIFLFKDHPRNKSIPLHDGICLVKRINLC